MNLAYIAKELGFENFPLIPIEGICIDTRQMKPNCLFIAIRGERFDGHDFMATAMANGAAAVVCEQRDARIASDLQLVVSDTKQALAEIASAHRRTIVCPVIAVTGSNGKTTVKEMIANILPKPSWATLGNFNNHIGAPLSVLQLNASHRYAVFELGANHAGEIAHTAAIVQPKVALITNIGPAHIEGFGSIEGVAKAKGEIYQSLQEDGIAVINADDAFAHFWDDTVSSKQVIRFSLRQPLEVSARNLRFDAKGCAWFTLVLGERSLDLCLQVPGEHSVYNALAAAAASYAIGIDAEDIVQGLQTFQGVAGRMTYRPGLNHALIIDDSYNANLRSVIAAVRVLAKHKGLRILVLGDMGELGPYTKEHHTAVGQEALAQGIDRVFTCGKHSFFTSEAFGASGKHYLSQEALAADILPLLDKDTTVLVKGSRAAQMERVVHQLLGEKTTCSIG